MHSPTGVQIHLTMRTSEATRSSFAFVGYRAYSPRSLVDKRIGLATASSPLAQRSRYSALRGDLCWGFAVKPKRPSGWPTASFAPNRPSNGLELNEDDTAPGAASWVGADARPIPAIRPSASGCFGFASQSLCRCASLRSVGTLQWVALQL